MKSCVPRECSREGDVPPLESRRAAIAATAGRVRGQPVGVVWYGAEGVPGCLHGGVDRQAELDEEAGNGAEQRDPGREEAAADHGEEVGGAERGP